MNHMSYWTTSSVDKGSKQVGVERGPADVPIFPLLQCEAPKIAKLVYNSNNYGLSYL